MPRCCSPLDLSPSYSSVLVAGLGLADAMDRLEAGPLSPCVTGWCTRCSRVSTLTPPDVVGSFPCDSAYAAHLLAFHKRLESTLCLDT